MRASIPRLIRAQVDLLLLLINCLAGAVAAAAALIIFTQTVRHL